jgi:hypothetical protein
MVDRSAKMMKIRMWSTADAPATDCELPWPLAPSNSAAMSPTKASKTSGVKTWKLKRGLFSVEVTAGVVRDKPTSPAGRPKAKKAATRRKKK